MKAFAVTAIVAFVAYLILTAGSGHLALWSIDEIIIGVILSIIVGILSRGIFVKKSYRMLNPKRWLFGLAYIGPFFIAMAKANLDVAYRVITGKIRPGIVKISPNLKTDLGITMLANSITLTPGTLSVDVDEKSNDLYVHWINVKDEAMKKMPRDYRYVCKNFPDWIRRIAE
ncbi:MAG: Na+/H+ antiporter subunit E [Thermoplasmata archaeon]|nr:Na+/H+ antiporter subunit E [Thermoplasmata archaeon]